jgi:hypothetical protein
MILDRVRQQVSSPTGTGGPLVLASVAFSNAYQTIAGAGGQDGDEYCYIIEEGLDWEIQRGLWTSGTNALARNTPMISSISGVASTSKMTLAGAATIRTIIDADELSYLRGTRVITTSTDTLVERAKGFMTLFNRSTAIAVAIGAPSGNSFKSGWISYMKNVGVGAITVTASGATITSDGLSTSAFTLNQYEQAILFSDGTNYHALITRQSLFTANLNLTAAQQANVLANAGGPSSGFANKFRNGTFDVWQRGTASISCPITTGSYVADGWIVIPTGAACLGQQAANSSTGPNSLFGMQITGATGVTGVIAKQRIAASEAVKLSGRTCTVQAKIVNNTGGSITPTISTKYCTTTANVWTSPTADLSATNLQACPNGVATLVSYTFAVSANANKGYEVTFDFGNNFSTSGKAIIIEEADIRVTPGVTTGLNSTPPSPEMRPTAIEIAICRQFFRASYTNAPGGSVLAGGAIAYNVPSNTIINGQIDGIVNWDMPMFGTPTVSIWGINGGAGKVSDGLSGTDLAASSGAVAASNPSFFEIGNTSGGSITTSGLVVAFHYQATAEL